MLAAAAGTTFNIPYSSAAQLQFAGDVARAFVAASLAGKPGASVHNLPGRRVAMPELIEALGIPGMSFSVGELPFPEELDSASFTDAFPEFRETPLERGVAATVERFRALLAEGLVQPPAQGAA
jgi:hypothetical protein